MNDLRSDRPARPEVSERDLAAAAPLDRAPRATKPRACSTCSPPPRSSATPRRRAHTKQTLLRRTAIKLGGRAMVSGKNPEPAPVEARMKQPAPKLVLDEHGRGWRGATVEAGGPGGVCGGGGGVVGPHRAPPAAT